MTDIEMALVCFINEFHKDGNSCSKRKKVFVGVEICEYLLLSF